MHHHPPLHPHHLQRLYQPLTPLSITTRSTTVTPLNSNPHSYRLLHHAISSSSTTANSTPEPQLGPGSKAPAPGARSKPHVSYLHQLGVDLAGHIGRGSIPVLADTSLGHQLLNEDDDRPRDYGVSQARLPAVTNRMKQVRSAAAGAACAAAACCMRLCQPAAAD
jgi:hypothetical protein